ncbi:aldose 1-epimerase [Pseudomonas sp. PSKL.D1]|uniref:aldose 1-epimerase n=1 Tax=Pseudomonas sp. PSKL.D1 TaxID=3029060 RepID=UPI0023819064|nr:aldose 1-epimerase [Pseudomonas sp. PSKL.D1]WDY59185.1 aldose 1-epimerase [Pseudomonas sp. PSKL.D1]
MAVPLLQLQDHLTQLEIAPTLGASLANWQVRATGQPLLRPADQAALATGSPRRLGCYPLVPWSNRIAEGGIAGPEGWLALPPNTDHDPYPIHGSAWQQPWQVEHHSQRRARLSLHSQVPFAYRATLDVQLHEGCLSLDLHVTHLDARPMWHGVGFHPYFPRYTDTQLQVAAHRVWVGDEGQLPSRLADIPAPWRFDEQKGLPPQTVDHAFSGWAGGCIIQQPGYALHCHASGAEHYLLFCPQGQPFFCFEPVSHPINAHHLPGRPGLRLMHREETLHLRFSMRYQSNC